MPIRITCRDNPAALPTQLNTEEMPWLRQESKRGVMRTENGELAVDAGQARH